MLLQNGRCSDFFHLIAKSVLNSAEQAFVFFRSRFCSFLFCFGFEFKIATTNVLEVLFLEYAKNLQAEFIHVIRTKENVKAVIQNRLGIGELRRAFHGFRRCEVNIFLGFGHCAYVFVQSDQLFFLCGIEDEKIGKNVLVSAVIVVYTEFQNSAEGFPERFVFFAIIFQHGKKLVFDLLFNILFHQTNLMILLKKLSADIQTDIGGIHNAANEIEIVGKKILAFFHDHNAGGIKRESLFKFLGIEIVRGIGGNKENCVVIDRAFTACSDHTRGIGIVIEIILIKFVVFLIGGFTLFAFPNRNHAVECFKLAVFLVFLLPIVTGILGLGNGMRVRHQHLDGITDIIAVFLNERLNAVFIKETVVIIIFGIFLDIKGDLRTDGRFRRFLDGIAFRSFGFPFPCFIRAESARHDGHFGSNHKGRIETDTELTDNIDLLGRIVGLEIQRTASRDRTEIVLQLILGHTDTVIQNTKRARFLIGNQRDRKIIGRNTDGFIGKTFETELVHRIGRIADQFTEKNLLIGINGIYHQVKKLLAFCLKLFYCHCRILL